MHADHPGIISELPVKLSMSDLRTADYTELEAVT